MKQIIAIVFLLTLCASCQIFGGKKVKGNGTIISRNESVKAFKSIEVSGGMLVRLKQDAASSLRIETDENLMEYIEVNVDGNTLEVHAKDGYNLDPSKEITLFISAPEYDKIDLSGATHLNTEGLITEDEIELQASGASEITMQIKCSSFNAGLSGASELKLNGEASKFDVDASGASKIRCMNLQTNETTLDLSGASEAEVAVEKQLNVEASGASNVSYRGNANIKQNSSGASNVRKAD